jgi:hypothetical protein
MIMSTTSENKGMLLLSKQPNGKKIFNHAFIYCVKFLHIYTIT